MRSIYLDNGATAFPKAPGVSRAMADYIDKVGANINRGVYQQAMDAGALVLETREMLGRLLGFSGPASRVIFTPGATYGLNQLLRGWLRPGDHAVVGSLEHNAVMRPLTDLSEQGVSFSRLPADSDGLADPEDLRPLLRPNTRLVLISQASNVCGALAPLKELAAICQEAGVPLAVDAAQTAGHYPIDFDGLGLAALCAPGHKGLLGPQGVGALLLNEALAHGLKPLVSGGTGSASDSERQPDHLPDRFESGTINLPGIFGFHAALEYVAERGVEALRRHEMALTRRLLAGLEGLPLRIVGPRDMERRVGVAAIDIPSQDNAMAAFRLEQEFGILTRCGLHCAPNAHKTLGTFPQGVIRFSVGYATTEQDIDQAIAAVTRIVS